jgi:gamma-glutamyltranspeptidase/glutathione hydrolase
MNVQEAGEAARCQHDGSEEPSGKPENPPGGLLYLEQGISQEVVESLKERGHNVSYRKTHYGSYQGILRENGVYRAGSEMRVDGQAAGY